MVLKEFTTNPNIVADGRGSLPDWYTHFGDEKFCLSAFNQSIYPWLSRAYPRNSVRIIALGAGNAFYERAIARQLKQEKKWNIHEVVATDLQPEALDHIPLTEPFPIRKLIADATQIDKYGLPMGDNLVLSRAVEHYLPPGGMESMIRATAALLKPGELYVAQISSGTQLAKRALSAGLHAIAEKQVDYMEVDAYVKRVEEVKENGNSLFRKVHQGHAIDQPRTSLDQARRYLTPAFLESHGLNQNVDFVVHVNKIVALREFLRQQVTNGKITREKAIKQLDGAISTTAVFQEFRRIFNDAVDTVWRSYGKAQHQGLKKTADGDIEIDITYPVVVWQRQDTRATSDGRRKTV